MREVYSDCGELSAQLSELLENDVLEHPAARAIARLVAEGDVSALTPDQRYIYEWHIKPHLHGGRSDEDPECIIM
jgi:hypothetical protein